MIEISHLSKFYGSFRALDDVSLSIPSGEVLGLLGPNGAGKTTTIRILTGYLPPTSGSARVDGHDSVTESHAVRRRLGYLPESNPLYPEMRVVEYLDFRGRLFGMDRESRRNAAERVIERCWLGEMRQRLIGRLSKGYRQRVGLAASMLHSPDVLILDEPTSGLDPRQIQETRHLIRELAGDHTMVLSSHILHEVELTCDRVAIIAHGKLRAQGTVSELKHKAGERGRYLVEVEASANGAIAKAVNALAGVESVESATMQGWTRMQIVPKKGSDDLRAALGQCVKDSGVLCRELTYESESLEQLFVRITSDAGGAALATKGGGS